MAKRKSKSPQRRVSPLKPGISGARNWATAQVRAASYSPKRMRRLIFTGLALLTFVLWGALWLGGFIPTLQASGARFSKQRLMNAGFVVKHVDVVGEGRISKQQVRGILGVRSGDYLFDMDIKSAQARVQSLNWVDTAVVRRLWPDRIVVHINERTPYALWQENGIINVMDKDGVVIAAVKSAQFNALPFVVGAGAGEKASAFLGELGTHNYLKNKIEAIVFVSQRRWDIVLKDNGPRILLPASDLQGALRRLGAYHAKHGVLDLPLEHIDMRVKGRLTLRPISQSAQTRA